MIDPRLTIAREGTFEGVGLHTGERVTLRLIPSDSGIVFRFGSSSVAATPANVTDTRRCTRLGEISTVEHLMSALAAHEITDVTAELTYPELPAGDGSALPFSALLSELGTEKIGELAHRDMFTRRYLQQESVKIAVGKGEGKWGFTFDSGDRWPGVQSYETAQVLADFKTEIAPARTTVFASEIEAAKSAGLGRGLTEESVVILGETGYGTPVRFDNEPARHKLLDLIGDLYLAGIPLRHLNVHGYASGHRTNVEMATMLYKDIGE
ncbi:MAG TPA: UDP-3-O-acyl-N-acetylglucosamine deacetylase [Fimbriimonas sp.]|nr:UDP-3-O-acyl-N-acetylglucosamine deacetylase [Fimbriimonas sp.]